MHLPPLLIWIVVGAVAGLVASLLAKGPRTIGVVAGLVGGILGGFLGLNLIEPRWGAEYYLVPSIACAAVGGLSLALVIAFIRKPR